MALPSSVGCGRRPLYALPTLRPDSPPLASGARGAVPKDPIGEGSGTLTVSDRASLTLGDVAVLSVCGRLCGVVVAMVRDAGQGAPCDPVEVSSSDWSVSRRSVGWVPDRADAWRARRSDHAVMIKCRFKMANLRAGAKNQNCFHVCFTYDDVLTRLESSLLSHSDTVCTLVRSEPESNDS